jgi:glycerol-3-phosphate dehydrogenase
LSDLPVQSESTQTDFSFRSREQNLRRLKEETFDFLIIGGGITGAGVARDAARRGLKVALVERSDFAVGTSSRSSKLIHGGLRYLENFEFGLVFEALSERANLLRTAPHMVRPLKFYFPVYQGDANGRFVLLCGMWLYDILSLFRAPGFHKSLSRRKMLKEIPFLKKQGLGGGFSYYDASMWDDVMVVEVMRSAAQSDAVIANYVEALAPIWTQSPRGDKITGFKVRDTLSPHSHSMGAEFEIKAHRTIVCAGPWTDELGQRMSREWKNWLSPSKGVHLIFDLKRIPIQGAMVMSHPVDGRISFVIPRPDFGAGVVVVGTTDGPSPAEPSLADVSRDDVEYLLDLLNRYFPDLEIKASDILSAYVGVRPLVGGDDASIEKLQKVSREHHIDVGPGRTTVVAGGKYTTYRKMAEEIVEFTLERWRADSERERDDQPPASLRNPETREPMNPQATPEAIAKAKLFAASKKMELPRELLERYGANALIVRELALKDPAPTLAWPEGFPDLGAQLRYCIRHEMTLHLRDFYFRRLPLYASRADHGLPWAEALSHVWAEELGKDVADRVRELEQLRQEIAARSSWQNQLK